MKNATSGTSPQKKTTPLSVHYRPTTAKKRADRKSDRDERWCTRTNAILVPIECRINETLIFEIQCNVRSKQWSFTFEKGKTKSDKLSEAVPSRKNSRNGTFAEGPASKVVPEVSRQARLLG